MKCPDCRATTQYDRVNDVHYCTVCLWDEVLDTMEWA